MSTARAVPDSGSDTSVDPDTNTADPIASLRAGEQNTKRVLTEHTGQQNRPDPYIYSHFIHQASFVWRTDQLPGTLLWSAPIHPSQTNWFLDSITRQYNCWSGGFEYSIKVAGTGFHAGSIIFCRIPPNRRPEEITNPQAFTVFEWRYMDPKELALTGFEVMDQRPIEYHYNPLDLDNPNSFGGFIAAYVWLPLQTASQGGNPQIGVGILSRASNNFNVSQPVPPLTTSPSQSFLDYEDIFPPFAAWHVPQDWIAAKYLEANPTVLVADIQGQVQATIHGKPFNDGKPYVAMHSVIFANTAEMNIGQIGNPWADLRRENAVYSGLSSTNTLNFTGINNSAGFSSAYFTCGNFSSVSGGVTAWQPTLNLTGNSFTGPNVLSGLTSVPGDNTVQIPNGDETILLFHSDNYTPGGNYRLQTTQSDHMYRTLVRLSGSYSWAANAAIIFTLIHIPTANPVAFVKLYATGLMTTNRRTTITTWRLADYRLSFYTVATDISPIPTAPPSFAANQLAVDAKEKILEMETKYAKNMQALEERVQNLTVDKDAYWYHYRNGADERDGVDMNVLRNASRGLLDHPVFTSAARLKLTQHPHIDENGRPTLFCRETREAVARILDEELSRLTDHSGAEPSDPCLD